MNGFEKALWVPLGEKWINVIFRLICQWISWTLDIFVLLFNTKRYKVAKYSIKRSQHVWLGVGSRQGVGAVAWALLEEENENSSWPFYLVAKCLLYPKMCLIWDAVCPWCASKNPFPKSIAFFNEDDWYNR